MSMKKLWAGREMRQRFKSMTAGLLALLLVFSAVPAMQVFAADAPEMPNLNRFYEASGDSVELVHQLGTGVMAEEAAAFEIMQAETRTAALSAARMHDQFSGLIGFEGDYALEDSDRPVSVIVLFAHNPAGVQVALAEEDGLFMPFAAAEAIVEDDHATFRREIASLFGNGLGRMAAYEITDEWRLAVNGVAVTMPSNMVAELLNFESVLAVYPNEMLPFHPVTELALDDFSAITSVMAGQVGPAGNAAGRAMTRADDMHALGYRGEGVLIAVIDSGIDYNHPSFWGAFPTLEQMHARGATHITQADLLYIRGADGEFGYYYVGRDLVPAGLGQNPNPASPMETSPSLSANPAHWHNHGTHVSGLAFARESAGSDQMRGIAPGAFGIVYRGGGFGGGIFVVSSLNGFERAAMDRADIVNLSFGGEAGPWGLSTIGVTNTVIQFGTIFTNSAGNNGPNFHTITGPGNSAMGITVAMNAVEAVGQTAFGLRFEGGGVDGPISFMGGQTLLPHMWREGPNGSIVSTHPLAEGNYNDEGEMRMIALPRLQNNANSVALNIGIGEAAEFAALVELHGAEALQGAWLVVSRGYGFTAMADRASALGMAGVVSINTATQAVPSGQAPNTHDHTFALFAMNNANGLILANAIHENEGIINFRLTDFEGGWDFPERVNIGSSRGPVDTAFDIKPDIGSHGEIVLSTVPWWTAENAAGDYEGSYRWFSGTSMSAPITAGVAALILQYVGEADFAAPNETLYDRWGVDYYEVRARLMNNAYGWPRLGSFYNVTSPIARPGVFDTGAGGADAYAAAMATAFVTAPLTRVGTDPGRYGHTTQAGSVSFGLMAPGETATITGNIHGGTIASVAHEFFTDVRNAGHDIGLATVNNGDTFDVTITMPTDEAYMGLHFQGRIIVTTTAGEVLRMPFAAVLGEVRQPVEVISEIFTYRPVISTGPYQQNFTSAHLGLIYRPHFGFTYDMWVVRDVPGVDATNWHHAENREHVVGYVDSRIVANWHAIFAPNPANVNFALGQLNRGLVDLQTLRPMAGNALVPPATTPRVDFVEEGDFFLVMAVMQQLPGDLGWVPPTAWSQDILIPFSVDNTPPQFATLNINGNNVNLDAEELTANVLPNADTTDVVITGNVYDVWLNQAIEDGVTFDIWRDTIEIGGFPSMANPFGPEVSVPSNLVLWALVGDNVVGNRPVDAVIDENGDFTVTLPGMLGEDLTELTLWLIDGYSAIPRIDGILGTTGWSSSSTVFTLPFIDFFHPDSVLAVPANVSNLAINQAFIHGWNTGTGTTLVPGGFAHHVWSGLNMRELNVTITREEAPVLSFDIFNNGEGGSPSRPNAGLAANGTIRMWTQLDGVNAPVPYADLDVTAVFENGDSAMEFVHINNMWPNTENVNRIDVSMRPATWDVIYLTATLFGTTVEVKLVNPEYVPFVAPVLSFDIFNNGQGGSPSRPNAGLAANGTIRMWTQLDGANALVPYADLEVEAVFENGESAMEFVRVNNMWANPGNVNNIDVSMRPATWDVIYLTATLFDTTVEVKLVNPEYVPFEPQGHTFTVNFEGMNDITVRYSTRLGGWATVTDGDIDMFDNTVTFTIPANDDTWNTIQVLRAGTLMSYRWDGLAVVDGGEDIFTVPTREIVVSGINGPGLVSLVQGGWVYHNVPITGNNVANPFLVFDNGNAYEIRVMAANYHALSGTMTSASDNDSVWFANTFSQHLIPEGVSNIRVSNANWVNTAVTFSSWFGGDVITLFNNNTAAVIHFEHGGQAYRFEFVLNGSNPFAEFLMGE